MTTDEPSVEQWRGLMEDTERRRQLTAALRESLDATTELTFALFSQGLLLRQAVRLLDFALHLRMYGENAPGGSETWAQFDGDVEGFLRSLPSRETSYPPVRVPENAGKHPAESTGIMTYDGIQLCGARGMAEAPGCIRPAGHSGGHGYGDGSGNQDGIPIGRP